jgi:glyoxylase-like metal-dependent hydrolase (beta-lactamase superfamily II)
MGRKMVEAGFHYTVGNYRCVIFSDGKLVSEGVEVVEEFGLNCILIDTGKNKILVDTGCGDGFQATAGHLVENMEAAGISCADIDRIILTHGHIDHASGCCDSRGRHVFPNARYITLEREWAYWETGPGANEVQNMFFAPARKNLLPAAVKFDLVKDDAEVLPGIRMISAPGHTPGNAMVEISSGKDRLLCIGDIIHSQLEFTDPEHLVAFDVTPEQAINTRNRILTETAEAGTPVFACHFQFPGLGYISRQEGIFSWQPLGN